MILKYNFQNNSVLWLDSIVSTVITVLKCWYASAIANILGLSWSMMLIVIILTILNLVLVWSLLARVFVLI